VEEAGTVDPINLSATFTDAGPDDTWTRQVMWDDGTTTARTAAAGTCTSSETHDAAGMCSIGVQVTDDESGSDTRTIMIVVCDQRRQAPTW
jgi:hypothetical protein